MTNSIERPQNMGSIIELVFDYWVSLSDASGRPQVSAFDAIDLGTANPEALPHIWLVDVEREPYRFRYRIVGGEVKAAGGLPNSGDYVDQFDPTGTIREKMIEVSETGRFWRRKGVPLMPHKKEVMELESLVLPMFDPNGIVTKLLGCTMYSWQKGFASTRI